MASPPAGAEPDEAPTDPVPGEGRVVRVAPDVVGIDKEFDYLVPAAWMGDGRADRIAVGSMVRVPLHGRRVGGWITAVDVEPGSGHRLSPLAKLSGVGPPAELIDLAGWGAWRWAGSRVSLLRAASPPRMVDHLPTGARSPASVSGPDGGFEGAFDLPVAVLRLPPAHDPVPVALAACRRGDSLIVAADAPVARHVAIALRRAGVVVAAGPDDWSVAAAGGATVVSTRSAAWMPVPDLAAVVVIDEHDDGLKEQRTPAWHARDVALERARRREVPAVLVSAAPSLEALRAGRLLRPDRSVEREGWPRTIVLDRRDEDPVRGGLFAEGLVDLVRGDGRVVCVLNRRGRGRLLACTACGELVRSEDGSVAMVQTDDGLSRPDGSEPRPAVCAECGSTRLKVVRSGVSRARVDLAALVGEPVDEVSSDTGAVPSTRVVIGTEAVLHRVDRADVVVFLDFDQELLAPRQRGAEQALALAARGARLLGARATSGPLVLQTRQPEHDVVRALVRGDPSIVAVAERDRRQARNWPPYGVQARVSGPGAAAFIAALGSPPGVTALGPRDGSWLLRAPAHEPLLDALASTPRPPERVRVEVDPTRV